MALFELTPDAVEDLEAIWSFVFPDNSAAADAVAREIEAACVLLTEGPCEATSVGI